MRWGSRFLVLSSLSLLVLPAACADEAATLGSEVSEVNDYGACSLSRKAIQESTSPLRQAAIARGFEWLDAKVQYNQAAQHEGYRTDCSGFVSMCWDIGGPGSNTSLFASGKGKAKVLGSYDELLPADALLRSGHVILFLAWNDRAKSEACNTSTDMRFRVRKTSALKAEGYRGLRADKLAKDLGAPQKAATASTPTSDSQKTDASAPVSSPDAAAPTTEEKERTSTETESETETETTTADRLEPQAEKGDPGDVPESKEPRTREGTETASAGCTASPSFRHDGGLAIGALFALATGLARRRIRRGGK
jgi:hypothetical protein